MKKEIFLSLLYVCSSAVLAKSTIDNVDCVSGDKTKLTFDLKSAVNHVNDRLIIKTSSGNKLGLLSSKGVAKITLGREQFPISVSIDDSDILWSIDKDCNLEKRNP